MAHILVTLSFTWKTWVEFQGSDFSLAQLCLLWTFGGVNQWIELFLFIFVSRSNKMKIQIF